MAVAVPADTACPVAGRTLVVVGTDPVAVRSPGEGLAGTGWGYRCSSRWSRHCFGCSTTVAFGCLVLGPHRDELEQEIGGIGGVRRRPEGKCVNTLSCEAIVRE